MWQVSSKYFDFCILGLCTAIGKFLLFHVLYNIHVSLLYILLRKRSSFPCQRLWRLCICVTSMILKILLSLINNFMQKHEVTLLYCNEFIINFINKWKTTTKDGPFIKYINFIAAYFQNVGKHSCLHCRSACVFLIILLQYRTYLNNHQVQSSFFCQKKVKF